MADAPKTKGMVALIPTAADAERLAVEGGLPVDELHLTLLFLGDAADWDDDARTGLVAAVRTTVGTGVIEGEGFALSAFNAGNDDHDTCIVLGVGGQSVADIHTAVVEAATDAVPEQRAPWAAHLSLIYTDDLAVLAELVDRTGPVTFDRLRVAFADTVIDIALDPEGLGATNRHGQPKGDAVDKSRLKTARPLARLREGRTDWYKIQNLASSGAAEVWIYDEIGYWGTSAQEFVAELNAIKASKVDVHINSPGGEAFDGLAIYQALRNHPAHITTYVDALAASAASFIAMAGDERIIAPHASLMIHDAFGLCIGNAAEMAKMQDDLARLSDNLAAIYASRAGGEAATWREAMRAETWYSAEEAVATGLAHRVQVDEKAAEKPDTPAAKNSWDLSIFNFAGRDKAPTPKNTAPVVEEPTLPIPEVADPSPDGQPVGGAPTPELPAAEPEPTTDPKEDLVSTELSDVRSRLGLPDDADNDAIFAALDELKAKAETPTQPDPDVLAAADEATKEAEELRQEVKVLASHVKTMSAKLASSEEEKAAAKKMAILNEAQGLGKFTPAEREQWEKDYDEAPGVTTRLLNRIAEGYAVPVNAAGVVGAAEPDATGADVPDDIAGLFSTPFSSKEA